MQVGGRGHREGGPLLCLGRPPARWQLFVGDAPFKALVVCVRACASVSVCVCVCVCVYASVCVIKAALSAIGKLLQ